MRSIYIGSANNPNQTVETVKKMFDGKLCFAIGLKGNSVSSLEALKARWPQIEVVLLFPEVCNPKYLSHRDGHVLQPCILKWNETSPTAAVSKPAMKPDMAATNARLVAAGLGRAAAL